MHIGIDFSTTSPGICIKTNADRYHWISYIDEDKGTKKHKKTRDEVLSNLSTVTVQTFSRETGFEFSNDYHKISYYINFAKDIVHLIHGLDLDEDIESVSLEGFSFGSRTNHIIETVSANTILKYLLITELGVNDISIFAPGTVKKTAGKGNFKKPDMLRSFLDNGPDCDFKTHCLEYSDLKKIPPPIEDLIDSYWVLQTKLLTLDESRFEEL